MMKDFNKELFKLCEKYWNPIDEDTYWDQLTDDAMSLISQFQTNDAVMNNFLSNIVVAFLNSREELSA
jgi:hypothetical protein